MTNLSNLLQYSANLELAKRKLLHFVQFTMPAYKANWHHELLCEYLDALTLGEIKKLMVFMPPQHGKSQLVSRHLPAYLLGINPSLKIVGSSYSADLSAQFNRAVQRIIDSELYSLVFPKTKLSSANVVSASKGIALRNADIFETLDYFGFYKSVGVGGSLTGTPADIAIIDDPVKDAVQATSPTYQKRVWDWYDQVLETRLHNGSKTVLTMTRWDKGDLAGRILDRQNGWEVLTLEGIKQRILHPKDYRNIGDALWESRHSKERLLEKQKISERTFNALYQQRPDRSAKGLVYPNWHLASQSDFDALPIEPIYGLDFGFASDKLAMVGIKIYNNSLYATELIYESGLTNSMLISQLAKLEIDKNSYIYADSASPDRIAEMRKSGYNVHGASKGAGSIIAGILKVSEFTLYINENSVNLQSELNEYKYKEDANGEPLPSISEGQDHLMDALRYAIYTRYKQQPQKVVFVKSYDKSTNKARR